jgi:nitroimidazol reductase NimA-like FMN-containing flavoprotein (pyridoxamine 5'-phosphate oxidase superfamily)
VGFVIDGQPYVLPTVHARVGDELYLHGSVANRMFGALGAGAPLCVTVTLLDGLVLARAAFKHSMNYRSVVILGAAHALGAEHDKRRAMLAVVERVLPGRAAQVREPSQQELNATIVLRLAITEASAKIRSGPPLDAEEDHALGVWAGVLPLHLAAGRPEPDSRLPGATAPPGTLTSWSRGAARTPR